MKTYKIFSISDGFSLNSLRRTGEELLNDLSQKGWHVVNVSTLHNQWGKYVMHVTAYQEKLL